MNERERAGSRARAFFNGLWEQGDYWQLDTSAFEQAKYVLTSMFEKPVQERPAGRDNEPGGHER